MGQNGMLIVIHGLGDSKGCTIMLLDQKKIETGICGIIGHFTVKRRFSPFSAINFIVYNGYSSFLNTLVDIQLICQSFSVPPQRQNIILHVNGLDSS